MIALLTTLPARVVFPGTALHLRCRFVDEATDIDQTPAAVDLLVRDPGGSLATYTWTAPPPGTLPTFDARLLDFSVTTTASMVIFEGLLAITSADGPGTYTYGWRALDSSSNELVTQWSSIDVEPEASMPTQPAPTAAPPNPQDYLGADVWNRDGYQWRWWGP